MTLFNRSKSAPNKAQVRQGIALFVGDTIAFLVFATIGRASHNEAAGLSAFLQVVETAAPFALGWFAVAAFAGTYRADVAQRPRVMLERTALGWLLGWPIGLLLRAVIRQTTIPFSFAVVTLVTNMAILLAWRGLFAWIQRRR